MCFFGKKNTKLLVQNLTPDCISVARRRKHKQIEAVVPHLLNFLNDVF
jgi:hypothetical protein